MKKAQPTVQDTINSMMKEHNRDLTKSEQELMNNFLNKQLMLAKTAKIR